MLLSWSSTSWPDLVETAVTGQIPILAPWYHLEELSGGELIVQLVLGFHVLDPKVLHNIIHMIIEHFLVLHYISLDLSVGHLQENRAETTVVRTRT